MSGSSRVAAQISPSERSTSLPTETKPAKPVPRALPRDISAPIMLPLWEAAKMRPSGKSVRRTDDADAVARARLTQARFARHAFVARLRETVGQHGRDLDAERPALLDRGDGRLGRRHDIGVLWRLGQRRERGPGAFAQHRVA